MPRLLPSRRTVPALLLVPAVALGGCRDVPTDVPAGLAIEVVQGAPAQGRPGFPLPGLLIVRVVDDRGRPVEGAAVSWGVEGGGRLTPGSARSGRDGLVAAKWTLGARPGPNRATASIADLPSVGFLTEGAGFKVDRLDSDFGHACGIRADGLWCWGHNWTAYGAAELPPGASAVLVSDAHAWTDVAVASGNVCVLEPGGTPWCLGHSFGTTEGPSGTPDELAPIAGLPNLSRIGSGSGWYCGLAAADSMPWCWGNDENGRFTTPVTGGPPLVQLAVGGGFSGPFACGIAADSTAHCWGDGSSGQLGQGLFESSDSPVPVSGGHRFVELAAGVRFACGRRADGSVWCWGDNGAGQLGAPGPASPVPTRGPVFASAIAAGDTGVLAISGAEILVWGWFGLTPGPLRSLDGLAVAGFSQGDIGCVIVSGGQAWCFGEIWPSTSAIDVLNYHAVAPD